MSIGSLFAGIGGFDLAARWMGWRTAWFSEIEPYASAVLKKHWPTVPNHGDITQIKGDAVERVDILCGGFPCQDISVAGKGAGLEGARSGLWSHYARLIEEVRPRYVVAENVAVLRSRGLDKVLGKLTALGYDAEWHCIPASAVGAPHQRDRIWIVAYDNSQRQLQPEGCQQDLWGRISNAVVSVGADTNGSGLHERRRAISVSSEQPASECVGQEISGRACGGQSVCGRASWETGCPVCGDCEVSWRRSWLSEPDVGRVANGVPSRVDRLRCCGNAIVPQVAYALFQAIEQREQRLN